MSEDEYARVRENLIEGDPIAVVDELLELRRAVAGHGDEYAVQWKEISTGIILDTEDDFFWGSEADARTILKEYHEATENLEATGGKIYFAGELVKRRKAGKPGKVEKA